MSLDEKIDKAALDAERVAGLRRLGRSARSHSELKRLVAALTDENESLANALETSLGMEGRKPLRLKAAKKKRSKKQWCLPGAMHSDNHFEEIVDPAGVHGLNEHNLEISERRWEANVSRTLKLMQEREHHEYVSEAFVFLGGDHITGHLHKDAVEETELAPQRAIEVAEDRLVWALEQYRDGLACGRIAVMTQYGNHGKVEPGRPRISTMPLHNYEQQMFRRIAKRYADDDRVSVDCTDSSSKLLAVECAEGREFVIRGAHGDCFNYHGGSGGPQVPLGKWIRSSDVGARADLTLVGHYHTWAVLAMVDALMNGSSIGYNAFAMAKGFAWEPPAQLFFTVDRDRAELSGAYKTWCD